MRAIFRPIAAFAWLNDPAPCLQMLCTFSALHHNSVLVVIVWTTAGGAAIEACVAYLLRCGLLRNAWFRRQRKAAGLGVQWI